MRRRTLLIACALQLAVGLAWAEMPAALIDANSPTASDWARAAPLLRAAIECRAPLPPSIPVRAVFRLTNGRLGGHHAFPEPLTVFDSLRVSAMAIVEGAEGDGSSYAVQPEGVTMAEVIQSARLRKSGTRYIRRVEGGLIMASMPQSGVVRLVCIRDGDHPAPGNVP